MSHSYYNKQWSEAQAALQDLLMQERPPEPPKPEKDRVAVFQMLATMYIKYVQIFRKLEQCYDQVAHPQKRRVLRHVLDGTMGRILELKQEMVDLEFSEFHYFDDVLSDLKLTPDDIEMPVPKYFINERTKALKEREKLLNHILARIGLPEKDSEEVKISEEEAIRMIQKHERARQGRLRAKFMREIRQQEERERMAANRGAPTLDPDVAATRIIKLWKGFSQRRRTKEERDTEMMFIGMSKIPHQGSMKNTPQAIAAKTEDERRIKQAQHEQEYQTALKTIKEKVQESEGPDMKERLQDMIRQWFIEFKDNIGKLPEFPDEDDGGSKLIFAEKTPEQLAQELAESDDKKGKKDKKDKKDKKKDKKDKKDKKGKGKGKGQDDDDEEDGWKMKPSGFVPAVDEGSLTYNSVWLPKDESDNFMQKHDAELIREEKRKEVEEEVRVQVDELMREELKNLKLALEKDKGKKKKKSGKKKKKKKSGKKGKKGKKEKDLTPDRTIEDLYQELVQEGIIVRPQRIPLKQYEGEYSYLGTTLRQANIEPQPSLSDIRRIVTEFAILPLGSPGVHETAPLIKSLLISGPKGTGKTMLVHAICTELGANLFDLSAKNLEGKYPGKDGLKMLLHMIFKVGRALQPSIMYVDEAEKMFKKKIPKTDLTDPKRLKKDLPKALKTIKGEDRIMLIGTSYLPWEGDIKPLEGCYQKIVLVPRPDYASRHLLWRNIIEKNGGHIKDSFDVSSLAKVTDGYTPGQLMECCKSVLTERRVNQLAKKPLTTLEFVAPLARHDPVYKEEEDMFKEWYNNKTKLGKKRKKAAEGDGEDDPKGKGKGAKGKKGKKK